MNCARIPVGDEFREEVTRESPRALSCIGESQTNAARVGNLVRHTHKCSTRTVLLNAASGPTPTRQAIGHNAQMTEFASGPEPATQQLIARHDRPAHARADGQHRHVVSLTRYAEAKLCPARRIRVVVDCDVEVDSRA